MSKRENEIVADQSMTHQLLDTGWSLSPLFVWLRFFGIVLTGSAKLVTLRSYFSQSFRLFALVCMVAFRIYIIRETTRQVFSFSALKAKGVVTDFTSTQLWSEALRSITNNLVLIAMQITIFIVSYSRWKHLHSCIHRIEQTMKFKRNYYIQLRRVCVVGMLWLLLVFNSQPL